MIGGRKVRRKIRIDDEDDDEDENDERRRSSKNTDRRGRHERRMQMKVIHLLVLSAALMLPARLAGGAEKEGTLMRWKFPAAVRYVYEYSDEQTIVFGDGKDADDDATSPVARSSGPLVISDGDVATLSLTKKVTPLGLMADVPPTEEKVSYRLLPGGTCLKEGSDLEEAPGIPFFFLPRRRLPPDEPVEEHFALELFSGLGDPPLEGNTTFTHLGTEKVNDMECVKYRAACRLRSERGKKSRGLDCDLDAVFAHMGGYFISVDQKLIMTHNNPSASEGGIIHVPEKFSFISRILLRLKSVEDVPSENEK
ncbi:MAG: hypothetical protein HQ592_09815 [Planctomycetes bacterium]|nr:hypothetical protein [Planctomycetota bacterium]